MPTEPRYFVWTESFTVKAFEIDTDGHILLSALANYMQDAAGNHAARLGFSMESMVANNQGWVLNRFTIRMTRYPKSGETIRIETWPSGADRLFGWRDFDLYDADGNHILAARTGWIILDIARRRPIPTPEAVQRVGAANKRFANVEVAKRLPKIETEPDTEVPFRVRRADLDIMRHVNNVRYMEWVLEAMGGGLEPARPEYIDIQFKAESTYGDRVIAEQHPPTSDGRMYRIRLDGEEKELAVALIR
ncbi:MAG: Acyl-ACP thioesterase [Bacteroidetes bacterium HLUCCA01]|nr:MAG: Acyl-ACP thioesterase [Bacteroidetes bacterium HLUCCA01]